MIYQVYKKNNSVVFNSNGNDIGDSIGYVCLCYGHITTQLIHKRLIDSGIVSESWLAVNEITHSVVTVKNRNYPNICVLSRKPSREVLFQLVPIPGQDNSDAYTLGKNKFSSLSDIAFASTTWAGMTNTIAATPLQYQYVDVNATVQYTRAASQWVIAPREGTAHEQHREEPRPAQQQYNLQYFVDQIIVPAPGALPPDNQNNE